MKNDILGNVTEDMENQSAVSQAPIIDSICSCLEKTFSIAADLSSTMNADYEAKLASTRAISYNPSCSSVRSILKDGVDVVDKLRQKIDQLLEKINENRM